MMTGRLYIDGVDVYKRYGIYVVQGGWNELISYPPLKPCDSNDWQEEDGIEVDLSSPLLNSRELSIKIAINDIDNFSAFISELSSKVYHTLNCSYIKRIYKLRLVSIPNVSVVEALGIATLKLADDFPLLDYNYMPPERSLSLNDKYLIDEKTFADYGVHVLKGTLEDFLKPPIVKTNLLRNIGTKSGALYGDNMVTYKSKDAKIYCLLRADTLEELWKKYDALLYDFIKPGIRTIVIEDYAFGVHYKNSQVSEFYPDGKIWLQFAITVTIVNGVRGEMKYVRKSS